MAKTYIDKNGYERYKENDRLVHREVAFNELYNSGVHGSFSGNVIHHKDGNKLNNNPDNLQILSQEEHRAIHGIPEPIIIPKEYRTPEELERVLKFFRLRRKNKNDKIKLEDVLVWILIVLFAILGIKLLF